MSLYPDQTKIVQEFKDWLFDTEEIWSGLWAGAGYGKTFTTLALLKVLKQTDLDVHVTSMTNKAAEVLQDMCKAPTTTLHKAFGWYLEENTQTGDIDLIQPDDCAVKEGSFILVDEAGMVGEEVLKVLGKTAKKLKLRILFVGDFAQTFPVEKEGTKLRVPAYDQKMTKFELTIPKRQDEGDVLFALCQRLRASVFGGRMPKLSTVDQGNGKGVFVAEDFKGELVEAIKRHKAAGTLDKIKALGYRNRCVIKLNQLIRKEVFGIDTFEPQVGEELVANTTIKEYDNDAGGDKIIIANNEMVRVISTVEGSEYDLNGWWTEVVNLDGEEFTVFVPESPMVKDSALKALKREANEAKANGNSGVARYCWSNFFNILNKTADLRPTFALTINKAQGSTFEEVFIDFNDIDCCPDREAKARLAYTGTSRAAKKVTVKGYLI